MSFERIEACEKMMKIREKMKIFGIWFKSPKKKISISKESDSKKWNSYFYEEKTFQFSARPFYISSWFWEESIDFITDQKLMKFPVQQGPSKKKT